MPLCIYAKNDYCSVICNTNEHLQAPPARRSSKPPPTTAPAHVVSQPLDPEDPEWPEPVKSKQSNKIQRIILST